MRKGTNYHDDRPARQRLEEFIEQFESQLIAARKLGISQAFLSMMLNARARVPERVLRKMGYRREVKVVRIGPSVLSQ